MKLIEMNLRDYLDVLKSEAPAPGGGSVSALSGAQGAALVSMVCELTIPKERYAEFKELCQSVREEILEIYERLTLSIDEDTEAFSKVSAAMKLPKESDEEKAVRSQVIQEATVTATEVPYKVMELCLAGLETTARIVGRSNPNAASDLGVADLNLLAGVKGAYLNVMINLPSLKGEGVKERFADAGEIVETAQAIAEKIYAEVAASL